jgi:hypothetical protein
MYKYTQAKYLSIFNGTKSKVVTELFFQNLSYL